MAELLAKSPASADWWVVSCGGAIIIIVMIDRTIAITPSAVRLGDIASSKRSVDNFAPIQRVTGSLCSWRLLGRRSFALFAQLVQGTLERSRAFLDALDDETEPEKRTG